MALDSSCVVRHSAVIYDRGGRVVVARLHDLSEVKWSRLRSAISSASVSLTSSSCSAQAEDLAKIEPRRHELVLFRGGARVWEGPILNVSWGADGVTINAQDVFSYLSGTAISRLWDSTEGGNTSQVMTERFEEIIRWEMTEPYEAPVGTGSAAHVAVFPRWENLDTPANVIPYLDVRPGSVITTSRVYPFEMMVGDHLADLARSGVDFTVVGRSIVVWDSEQALSKTRTLTEDDFSGQVRVVASGESLAAISHAVGQVTQDPDTGEEIAPVVGHAGGTDLFYGPWERVVTSSTEVGAEGDAEQTALTTQAQRDLLGRLPTPLEIRVENASLILGDTLPLDSLVPGVIVPVVAQLNLRQVSQVQVLDGISVTEDPAGETVQPTLLPAGGVEVMS